MSGKSSFSNGYVQVEGGKIYYETTGDGPAVVLIHAGFLDRRMWDEQFELFSDNYRVVRYDVRGFGKSDRALDKFSDVDDLARLLNHLGIEKAHIVGVSNGGRIAIDFTANHPVRVDRLVLVGSGVNGYKSTGPDEDSLWEEFDRQMKPQEELVKEGRLEEAVRMDVEAWAAAQSPENKKKLLMIATENKHVLVDSPWKHLVHPQPSGFSRLSQFKTPTLVIVGDRDVRGMLFIADQIHKGIPGSQKLVVHGADHIVNMSKPEEFNRSVLDFLSKA